MEIRLRPFMTPNFVSMELPIGRREDGYNPDRGTIPLKDVPAQDLAWLCARFRADVFAKARKQDPGAGEKGKEA